jgi:DNA-binding PadR family transcriptional regulator
MFGDPTHTPSTESCDRGRGAGRERAGGKHRRHRHGGFWGGPGGFPFGDFPSGGGRYGRARKARRGDIRTAALLLLREEPRNGYQIMQQVEERSEGVWRPSAGSVYPALAQLEDEGLISSEESDGRKLFALTDAGRELLAQRADDAPTPWEQMSGPLSDEVADLGRVMRSLASAFVEVMRTGNGDQIAKAREILDEARRDLYHVLADGEAPGTKVDGDA